jgi:hypothetical protein
MASDLCLYLRDEETLEIMNRIILIGNGFDLAHGLPTGYRNFMDHYWTEFAKKINDGSVLRAHEDHLVKFEIGDTQAYNSLRMPDSELNSSASIRDFIKKCDYPALKLKIKNDLWGHISNKARLETWLDIENEYYEQLKQYLRKPGEVRNSWIKKLNEEFCQVKNLLEKYLTEVCEKQLPDIEPNAKIAEHLFFNIERKYVALSKQTAYADSIPDTKEKLLELTKEVILKEEEDRDQKQIQAMLTRSRYVKNPLCDMDENELEQVAEQTIEQMGIAPQNTLALNFNYTPTFEKLYASYAKLEIINIHGELNNPDNPMVFGYGDELDDDYKEIEKTNDNDFLENIKSVAYGNTDNYRRLLEFLQLGHYQVFIIGHSCGNSDRTLLNEIFEHSNCISVRQFYHERGDGTDDYSNVYKNISRNFNNKRNLRDIVVNKKYCKPLIPSES